MRYKDRLCRLFTFFAFDLLMPIMGVEAAVVFDAVTDFSMTENNDTSTWSYRYQNGLTRDGGYDLLEGFVTDPENWDPDIGNWRPGATPGFNPGVGVNNTGATATFTLNSNTFFWPDNTIWMHPNSNSLIVVSWLSPITGNVDIEFSFADMDPVFGDGIGWFVDLGDGNGELASGVFANGGNSGLQNIFDQPVTAGDRINFIVSPPGSDHGFDSTTFTATVTVIPEPATLSLIGLGLVGIMATVLVKRRATGPKAP